MGNFNKKTLLSIYIAITLWILLYIASYHPVLVQKYYTNDIYLLYSNYTNLLTKHLPFSVGDTVYIGLIGFILYNIFALISSPITVKKKLIQFGSNTILTVSIAWSIFNITWGLNNYNLPIDKQLDLEQSYTTQQLVEVTKLIIEKTKQQHQELAAHKDIAVKNNDSVDQIIQGVPMGIKQASKQLGIFSYRETSLKKSLYSSLITFMGFSGYINPLTNEAQINRHIPKLTMPITASHEVAHQYGFARESDANFIGFLANYHHNSLLNQYAANIFALRYCLGELNKKESEEFLAILQSIPQGIKDNILENAVFWHKHRNFTDSFFTLFYDTFLKVNNQQHGLQSYSKFVDLLINYQKKKPLY
ncbi:DUF3810 domain-containing protein [Myroides sp. LJL116]